MIKDIISDQDGLYRNPFDAAVIKGDKTHTTFISKYVADPFVAISPYGAEVVPSGTPETTMRGDTIGEFSFNTNQMNYAQEGGASSQQQQIVQQVAQMLQQGADPQQVMEQLVKMGIPSEQAEQLLTAVMQQMQSAMAEQEQMQDEDMGGQEQMPMAKDGGCIDCEEQFPQAQNLNWFYKAQGGTAYMMDDLYEAGGEAFPQANPYPHMYAEGGEAFPQAQTYLPYDRGGNPSPNFMFEYGGTTDIDQAYQIMKRGGFDMNPKKKKGGKFTDETFDEYVMRNGGKLPMHQWQISQTGFGGRDATQVVRPNVQFSGLQQVKPNPVNTFLGSLLNNQQAVNPMQNIMANSRPMNQQAQAAAAQSAAGARTAGSASGVRRTPPANTPASASVARDNTPVTMMTPRPAGPIPMQGMDATVQSSGDGFPTVTVDEKGNITPNQQEGYYNPFQAYTAGKTAANLFGTKGAAGLGLLSFIPGFGAAASNAGPMGGIFGRADKLKGNVVGPYGSFTGTDGRRGKIKGRDNIADMFNRLYTPPQKQFGGDADWEYSYYDVPAGMEDVGGAFAFQSGVMTGIDQKKLKEQQNKLRNQDTVSSGIAMGPMAAKTPGNAAVGTTNFMGAVNPFMSGQPGNFGLGTYGSSMLSNAKFGGNILDQFQDGAEVDLDGMSEQQIQDFVNAVYAAGGTIEYL